MSISDHKKLVTMWFTDLWSQGKLEIADSIIHETYKPSWIAIDKTGSNQVKHEVKYFRSGFPDLFYTIKDQIFSEEKAWIRYKGSATHIGLAWGFKPTNRKMSYEGVTIFTFKDNKIADRWSSFCFYDILTELQLVPPFWELHQTFQKE